MNEPEQKHDDFNTLKCTISKHHKAQLDLCERLEHIADALPHNFDRQECLSISWQLCSTVKEAHQFEEEKLFPLLNSFPGFPVEVSQSLERLKFEHWEDETSAEDICFTLRQMVHNPEDANIGKISYMLRGFFDGLRRHIAFEAEYLLPQLEHAMR